MARALWTGVISFGLVNVPVKLYTAVRDKSVRFRQLDKETGSRIRYRRVSEETGEEVPNDQIVRGYELGDGRHVTVEAEELEAAAPDGSRTINVEDFVRLADVDPRYFNSTYYAGPSDAAAERPYALLVRAMEETGQAAIGRLVMNTKEHLVIARPVEDRLTLHTMHFHDEVVDPSSIDAGSAEPEQRELDAARQLIEAWSSEWDPTRYEDRYRGRLLEVIDQKVRGEEVVAAPETPDTGEVVDLVAALKESVARRERPGAGRDDAATEQPREQASSTSLEGQSREDLYELAKERGIPGRSRMTKEQLVQALSEQEAPAQARSA